jgi:hypothetical protein
MVNHVNVLDPVLYCGIPQLVRGWELEPISASHLAGL